MKRSMLLLMLLPLLGSCSIQEDYYNNDYYQAQPLMMTRTNGPYNSFNRFTRHDRQIAPRNYHSHDNATVATNERTHGHQSDNTTTVHRHGDLQENNIHGHTDYSNNRTHGHD
ncbi:MAG: hypothetical protein Q8M03_06155 [Legionella sp.]|nr:hypothetical protein [Legionella sp.]